MTTLVALLSKHAVVMGSDSLGTQVRPMLNPIRLAQYFDAENDLKLRVKDDGTPVLEDLTELFDLSQNVPYNQLLHVNKLFKLGQLPIGVMYTGITSIGDRTIRSLIADFIEKDPAFRRNNRSNYTVRSISQRLLEFLREIYEATYERPYYFPDLELLVAGYSRNEQWPSVGRIDVKDNTAETELESGRFGIVFGGQMDWIQSIVFGANTRNKVRLQTHYEDLLSNYRQRIQEHVESAGLEITIPEAISFGDGLQLFHEWDFVGLDANWEEFSEQNAIDCVNFFLNIMIQSQDVSSELPTVGGNVHIAVIRKDGFHPVTKEVWRHGDHEVQIPEVGR